MVGGEDEGWSLVELSFGGEEISLTLCATRRVAVLDAVASLPGDRADNLRRAQ